jgi:hypothetical protein
VRLARESPSTDVDRRTVGSERNMLHSLPAVRHRESVVDRSSWTTQLITLVSRNVRVMVANRLTLAVMLGSPALVVAMMAVLFPPAPAGAPGGAPPPVVFWLAFAGFFFGLTFGLLQVVTERAVFERERFAGLRQSAYLASKLVVLTPVLGAVAGGLLAVLSILDRLPATSAHGLLLTTLVIESIAALLLGLAASALVTDAAQATLALPMLCFPQVLFACAVVPVADMTWPADAVSTLMVTRWSYEALGVVLAGGPAPLGRWLVLAALAAAAALAAGWALSRPHR